MRATVSVAIPVVINVKLPSTAADWELYTDRHLPQLVDAVAQMNLAMHAALGTIALEVSNGRTPDVEKVWEQYVSPTLERHRELGARDTEPRVLSKTILYNFAKKLGVNVDVQAAAWP